MSLAERGSHLPLDLTSADMTTKSDDNLEPEPAKNPPNSDNPYAAFAKLPPRPVFLWGKAVNKNLSEYFKYFCHIYMFCGFAENLTTYWAFNIHYQFSKCTSRYLTVLFTLQIIFRKLTF